MTAAKPGAITQSRSRAALAGKGPQTHSNAVTIGRHRNLQNPKLRSHFRVLRALEKTCHFHNRTTPKTAPGPGAKRYRM